MIELKRIVEHQANMESLWLLEPSLHEAMLQAALRHLHATIERQYIEAEMAKRKYWDLEEDL